jgi:hypothetical protein
MKVIKYIVFIFLLAYSDSCVVQFVPEINESMELLVVDGMITDQFRTNTVKLTKSIPIGSSTQKVNPVKGCLVTVSDNTGNVHTLKEIRPGVYITDSLTFRGILGRSYILHIQMNNLTYESVPMKLNPVPPIDSIYYEIKTSENTMTGFKKHSCQFYLNTHDPDNHCRFYRWEYVETWEFRLPFMYPPNRICWISNNSRKIFLMNTSSLEEDRVTRLPLDLITTETDRLKERYSLLVKQYSLNEDEYNYWRKIQMLNEEVGGLYDMIQMSVQSNISCIENPSEKVLGYFGVSSVSTKRIFISNIFTSDYFPDIYENCATETVPSKQNIPELNKTLWIIAEFYNPYPSLFYILTGTEGCADCTVRGTNIKPDFW